MDSIDALLMKNTTIENFYRKKRFGNKYLLTTDHGSWLFLDKEDYDKFYAGKELEAEVFNDLIERGIVITSGNIEEITSKWANRYNQIQTGPSLHIVVPTIRCNHCCIYCHSEAETILTSNAQFDMDESTMRKILEFIFQSPSPHFTIEFQGGEPLLNKPILKKIITYSRKLGEQYGKKFRIALVSNLASMDDEFFRYVIDNRDLVGISSSLDGPKELHDKNRKFLQAGASSYDQTVKWVNRFLENDFNIGLLMVTTKFSLPYYKEIIDEYVKFKQTKIQIKPLDYLGFAKKHWNKIGYSLEEFNIFWTKSINYMLELQNSGISIVERYFNLALKKIMRNIDIDYLDWSSPCGIIRGQIVYNYNGDIYPCDEARIFSDLVIGNVFEHAYKDILLKEKSLALINSSINDIYYCDSCAYKPFCGICYVLNHESCRDYKIKLNKTDRCIRLRHVFDYVFDLILNNRKLVKNIIMGQLISEKMKKINKE